MKTCQLLFEPYSTALIVLLHYDYIRNGTTSCLLFLVEKGFPKEVFFNATRSLHYASFEFQNILPFEVNPLLTCH